MVKRAKPKYRILLVLEPRKRSENMSVLYSEGNGGNVRM